MTEWRTPGDAEPDPAAADAPDATVEDAAASTAPRGSRRQTRLLVLAALLIAAAAVLALVVVLGGSDGPAKGSPDALGDDFAAALRTGSSTRLGELACPAERAQVLRAAGALGKAGSASRQGGATVQGDVAVARLAVTVHDQRRTGTLALSRLSGRWCVAAFLAAPAQ